MEVNTDIMKRNGSAQASKTKKDDEIEGHMVHGGSQPETGYCEKIPPAQLKHSKVL